MKIPCATSEVENSISMRPRDSMIREENRATNFIASSCGLNPGISAVGPKKGIITIIAECYISEIAKKNVIALH